MTPNGVYAVAYASAGWELWPIKAGTRSGTRRPHPHAPLGQRGVRSASSDPDQVAQWWRRWPLASIGAKVPPGLVVVDLDRHGDDPARHSRWHPDDFAPTLTAVTPAGHHLWYRAPGGVRLRSVLPGDPAWCGVDLLGAGKAIIVPPSLHESGQRRAWQFDHPIARLPGVIADAFAVPAFTSRPHDDGPRGGLLESLQRHLADLAQTPNGNRNRKVRDVAFYAGRIVGAGLLDEGTAIDLVLEAAPLAPDFTEREVLDVVGRAIRDGAARPLERRDPPPTNQTGPCR